MPARMDDVGTTRASTTLHRWIMKYKGLDERQMAVDQLTKMAAVSYHHFTAFMAGLNE